ncbi:MAG: phosphonate ABC transporter ATP-binding protein [Oscillospiraceae bacterium]|jgi:phosphonate transport system ATP-binding protein|nr:phosphonate ABC transporter ATP-binding protein [Oscillospiraceae bacterium]
MGAILSIRGLRKSYGAFEALRGVSLDFCPGEFAVVVGPSGAGKSTLIRCINRMIDPSYGEIEFNGVRMDALRGSGLRRRRSMIGMIFQHYNLIGRTNVIKNVLHGRLGHMPFIKSLFGLYPASDRLRAMELLEEIGLSGQRYKRADALSGGQMQRVGICRALMQEPRLLLADEPIASLDPKSAEIVMDHLKRMTEQRGICCIVNLHQVDFARRYASRVIGVKSGLVVFDGRPDDFTEDIARFIYENGGDRDIAEETQIGPEPGGYPAGEHPGGPSKEAPTVYAEEYAAV